MTSPLTGLVGALGSVVGYLGSEVAEPLLFERLLWPQRFYNDLTPSVILKQSLSMTMGGPLHGAALATLDRLRDNGLYLGKQRGNMLGTAFFKDSKLKYTIRSADSKAQSKDVRNGFWVEVLRSVDYLQGSLPLSSDEEQHKGTQPHRATQPVHFLTLSIAGADKQSRFVSEEHVTARLVFLLFCSETASIAAALVAGTILGLWWLFAYMLLPLIFKLLAVLLSVRREGLQSVEQLRKSGPMKELTACEIDYQSHGFALLKGPAPVIQQFFRHYGHPLRDQGSSLFGDRTREVLCMVLIYAFVIYFPAGLIISLWMTPEAQYLWLAYQVYAILVMHIVRVRGWQRCGSTEEGVARQLRQGKNVCLHTSAGATVAATLKTVGVESMKAGKELIQNHVK